MSTSDREIHHLVLFDGACGFCSAVVQFVLKRDRRAVFLFASLQSATGRAIVERAGEDPDALETLLVVQNFRTSNERVFARSQAALFVARELGGVYAAAGLLRVVPVRLANRVYDVIATPAPARLIRSLPGSDPRERSLH